MGDDFDETKMLYLNVGEFVTMPKENAAFPREQGRHNSAGSLRRHQGNWGGSSTCAAEDTAASRSKTENLIPGKWYLRREAGINTSDQMADTFWRAGRRLMLDFLALAGNTTRVPGVWNRALLNEGRDTARPGREQRYRDTSGARRSPGVSHRKRS